MNLKDLGELKGDLILFGGIYSNLSALNSLIDLAQEANVSPANMICTGDIVAYCADAYESLARIRALGCPVLMGNCEEQLAKNADDCGCGFQEGSHCSLLSRDWYSHAQDEMTQACRDWMGLLPHRIIFRHNGLRYVVIHGGARDIYAFIFPTAPDHVLEREMALLEQQVGQFDCVVAGHSGMPFVRHLHDKIWINTGAIGMPAHDGEKDTKYVTVSKNNIFINKLKYDIQKTIDRMYEKNLTQGYHQTLQTGYWPSEDTLPLEMRLFT